MKNSKYRIRNFKFGMEVSSLNAGFSFIELLVVIVLMGIVGIIISQIFILNVRSQGKSETLKEVKQSGDFALSVMESMIRNAADIRQTSCNINTQTLSIVNQDGYETQFDCSDGVQIASISAYEQPDSNVSVPLTSNRVTLNTCIFRVVCPTPPLSPKYVFLYYTLSQAVQDVAIEQQAQVEYQTTISLRNYQ